MEEEEEGEEEEEADGGGRGGRVMKAGCLRLVEGLDSVLHEAKHLHGRRRA